MTGFALTGRPEATDEGSRLSFYGFLDSQRKRPLEFGIERQLAHFDNDSVRHAYARADSWDERVEMMSWWADKYDELWRGGIMVPLRARAA
jgi:hypothetical protein